MNYSNNVRCDCIKPMERKLFRYLCKQIDYDNIVISQQCTVKNIQDKLLYFKEKYDISWRMIDYYISKWAQIGIIRYERIYGEYVMFIFRIRVWNERDPMKRRIGFYNVPLFSTQISMAPRAPRSAITTRIDIYSDMIPKRCCRLMHKYYMKI